MTTERTSLLTQGLAPLEAHASPKIRDLLARLYAIDDELQHAHTQAKRDDEFGEQVVTQYKRFLALRQILIDELERQHVAVPWQMRVRIDEIELTLRQREEKKSGNATSATTATTRITSRTGSNSSATATSASESDASESAAALPPASAQERRVVTLLVPSLVVLVLALLWYQWFAHAPSQ